MIDLGIELRVKSTSDAKYSAAKLVAVKGMPATGQAGGNVEITTSSDPVKVYVPDRPDTGDMDFTYNYSQTNLAAVQAVCDNIKKDILIKFPDGAGFEYQGVCQTWINEESVGGAMECTLHTTPSIAGTYLTAQQLAAKIETSS
jgi:hypothetical protein